jgi:putative acetyltransferase
VSLCVHSWFFTFDSSQATTCLKETIPQFWGTHPLSIRSISDVTKAAFENHPISQQTEHFIVNALRAAGMMTISLVAELDDRVVGHIALSLVSISDGSKGWYGLGPISVLPELQRQGIGKTLMHEGLSQLKALGASGCILIGDPNYYEQFGFKSLPELTHEGVPQEYVLTLPFADNKAQGMVTFHKAFAATE